MDVIIFEIQNIGQLNCHQVFALFLMYVYRFISPEFFGEMVFLVVILRDLMNSRGWEKYRTRAPEEGQGREFCVEKGPEYVPDLSNEFVGRFYAEYHASRRILAEPHRLQFIGADTVRIIRFILLVKHLCNWLHIFGFSQAKIEIKKD